MLKVKRFINDLMTSNCYVVYDEDTKSCLVIDPGSEKSLKEIEFIDSKELHLDYIIVTHEHTDHNWGVNSLLVNYPQAQVICHKLCEERMEEASTKYFRLYYDDEAYSYKVCKVDIAFSDNTYIHRWNNTIIKFEYTPGHSMGSICVIINKMIFTGDTIMPYKTYINKHDGSKELYKESVAFIENKYLNKGYIIEPGHGNPYIFQ